MQILALFGFTTIKQLETHGVGSLTGEIMLIFCSLSSSAFNNGFSAKDTFLEDELQCLVWFHLELDDIFLRDDLLLKKHQDSLQIAASC